MTDQGTPPAAQPLLRVRCASWREFAESYADDIASGGMYVASAAAFDLLSTIDVIMQLPEATEINLRARVVHVLGPEQASQQGKRPGLGLELIDVDPERKRQIVQLIEFARWQGASDDPKTSFARTLLELSPSLPPKELGRRLSQLPGPNVPNLPPRRGESRPITPANPTPSPWPSSAVRAARSLTPPSSRPPERLSSRPPQAGTPEATARPRRQSSQNMPGVNVAQPSSSVSQSLPTPAKPTDQAKLKLVLSNFAHKHFEAALAVTREMLEQNPGDPQALRWQALCNARIALLRKEEAQACSFYEQVLMYDPDHREAREFVRTHQRDKKLSSLPFGRYFTKKK